VKEGVPAEYAELPADESRKAEASEYWESLAGDGFDAAR